MNSAQRRIELPDHIAERDGERRSAANQHVIMAGAKRGRRRKPNHFPQAPPHAVALHGIADLTRHGEADPDRSALLVAGLAVFGALPRLQDEGCGRRPGAFRGRPKVRPAFQPFHGCDFGCDFGLDQSGLDLKIGVRNENLRPQKPALKRRAQV